MKHESSVTSISRRNALLAGISIAGSSLLPPLKALAEPVADEIKDYKLVQIFQVSPLQLSFMAIHNVHDRSARILELFDSCQ